MKETKYFSINRNQYQFKDSFECWFIHHLFTFIQKLNWSYDRWRSLERIVAQNRHCTCFSVNIFYQQRYTNLNHLCIFLNNYLIQEKIPSQTNLLIYFFGKLDFFNLLSLVWFCHNVFLAFLFVFSWSMSHYIIV